MTKAERKRARRMREELQDGITAMRYKHAEIAVLLLSKMAEALAFIPADAVRIPEIIRGIDVAVKLERLSRGDDDVGADRRRDDTVSDDFSDVSTADLRRLVQLFDGDKEL